MNPKISVETWCCTQQIYKKYIEIQIYSTHNMVLFVYSL